MTEVNEHFVKELLKCIVEFKQCYESVITSEELTRLKIWTKALQNFENIPIYDEHYVTCPYFSETNFDELIPPWTCLCKSPLYIRDRFEDLKNDYE